MKSLTLLTASLFARLASSIAIPHPEGSNSALVKRDGLCDGSGPFTANQVVGNAANGGPFCETGWNTRPYPVTVISIWATDLAVKGLQFGYADGYQSPIYGTNAFPEQSITLNIAGGETITDAYVFGTTDGSGSFVRGLTILTSAGQRVHGGDTTDDGQNVPYHASDVGAGLLYGAQGTYGPNFITSIELLFLRSPIAGISITNLQFPSGPSGTAGISPDSLDDVHYYNNGQTGSDTWTFNGNRQFQNTRSASQTTTNGFQSSTSVTFSAEFPIIIKTAGSTTTFTWSYSDAQMTGTQMAQTDNLAWTQSGSLDPGQGIDCSALIGTGGGTFPYSSTVTVTLDDGTQFAYSENGALQLSTVSSVAVSCTEDDNPQ